MKSLLFYKVICRRLIIICPFLLYLLSPLEASGGRYSVQLAALGTESAARTLVSQLMHKGYPAYSYKINIRGKIYYRVRCGWFKTRKKAEELRRKLAKDTGLQGFVTTEHKFAPRSETVDEFSAKKSKDHPFQKSQKATFSRKKARKMPKRPRSDSSLQASCFLKDEDVVVFYGDAITEQGIYCQMVTAGYQAAAQKYQLKDNIKFHAMGYKARTAKWAQKHIREVIAVKPTVVTLMWGMQDAYGQIHPKTKSLNEYRSTTTFCIRALQKAGVRPVILTLPPVDERRTRNYKNRVLEAYAQVQREVAVRMKAGLVDTRSALQLEATKVGRKVKGSGLGYLIDDDGQLNLVGHSIIAETILDAWHVPFGAENPNACNDEDMAPQLPQLRESVVVHTRGTP